MKKTFLYSVLDLNNEDLLYTLGKTNYDAYCNSTGGVSLVSGDKLPDFENLKEPIKKAWKEAAKELLISVSEP